MLLIKWLFRSFSEKFSQANSSLARKWAHLILFLLIINWLLKKLKMKSQILTTTSKVIHFLPFILFSDLIPNSLYQVYVAVVTYTGLLAFSSNISGVLLSQSCCSNCLEIFSVDIPGGSFLSLEFRSHKTLLVRPNLWPLWQLVCEDAPPLNHLFCYSCLVCSTPFIWGALQLAFDP